MRPHKVRRLLRRPALDLDRTRRRLAAAATVGDVRAMARARLPRAVFDYVDGGADEELSLQAASGAYRAWRFHPRSLVDVAAPDLGTTLLGARAAAPLGLAPTGYTRMISTAGEPAVAAAAAGAGVPYVLSTMATTSLEDVAAGAPGADLWFQLYVWKDRDLVASLVRRAAEAGYRVLEVSVDTAVSGHRVRDVRNGLTIPPALTLRSLVDIGAHPGYWSRLLTAPALRFANVDGGPAAGAAAGGCTVETITSQFDPAVTWEDVAAIRALWPGALLLKGPIGAGDARRARDLGVDGIHLSSHGGRQLDRTVPPLELVAPVRAALGEDATVLVDSGVRHGADIATALALGADACLVGRPYLWGLVAGGQAGVEAVLGLLVDQLRRTMQLLGTPTVAQLRAAGPSLLSRA